MGERDHLDNAVSSDLGEYMGIRRWANIAEKFNCSWRNVVLT